MFFDHNEYVGVRRLNVKKVQAFLREKMPNVKDLYFSENTAVNFHYNFPFFMNGITAEWDFILIDAYIDGEMQPFMNLPFFYKDDENWASSSSGNYVISLKELEPLCDDEIKFDDFTDSIINAPKIMKMIKKRALRNLSEFKDRFYN